MEIEQLEILDYLATCQPLDKLPAEVLDKLVNNLEIEYTPRGNEVLKIGDSNNYVYILRRGAVDVINDEGELENKLHEGEWFGYGAVLGNNKLIISVKTIEDSLFYVIPGAVFIDVVQHHDEIRRFFAKRKAKRLRGVLMQDSYKNSLLTTNVLELVTGKPQIVKPQCSIKEAARMMKQTNSSYLLICDKQKQLRGIITDRTFCTNVVADDLDSKLPIAEVMSSNLITIDASANSSEALLIMTRNNINHLPIVDDENVCGVITSTDLIRYQDNNAIYLAANISYAEDIAQLKTLSAQIPGVLVNLVNSNLQPYDIGHIISSISRSINQRLLLMAEQKYGPPPIAYCWVVAGSSARNEQTVHSDQDNLIILADDYDKEQHGKYFAELAKFVCDGLNECGFVYCPGEVMATNDKWRQRQSEWQKYFKHWINNPAPKALMYASIFFDLRSIHGEHQLLADIQHHFAPKIQKNSIFLAYMAANALHYQPPLGLFRHFVLEKGGAEDKALNMKRRGVVPIIDLARVYALAGGVYQINTLERLKDACANKVISQRGTDDLLDAFNFISMLRLRHQAQQIEKGKEPDNYVAPDVLSSLEKKHLKDAFDVVRTMQSALASAYQTERIA